MTSHPSETEPFPVVHSVLSASALAAGLLPDYAIGAVTSCKLLHHNLNDLYLVTTADAPYVLRVGQARGRCDDDVRFEVALLDHLRRSGVPVASPVPLRAGGFTRRLHAPEGPRQAVLFTFAQGHPLSAPDHNEAMARAYGRAAAWLHLASDDYISPHARFRHDTTFLVDSPLATTLPLLAHRPRDQQYLTDVGRDITTRICGLPAATADAGACHGDLTGGNVSIADDGTMTFFDFEFSGLGFRAYDLATFRWSAAMGRHRLGTEDDALWSAFLEGYAERRQIAEVDLAAVPLFVAARHLWYIGLQTANWDNWGHGEVDEAFFDRELAFLRAWMSTHLPV